MSRQKPALLRFLIAMASLALAQGILAFKIIVIEGDTTVDLLWITGILAILSYFFYKGHNWSRWILAVVLAFFAFALYFAGSEDGDFEFLFAAVGYTVSLIAVIGRIKKSELRPVQVRPSAGKFEANDVVYDYPRLVVRYKALLIDAVIIMTLMVIAMVVLGDSEYRSTVLITMGVLGVFAYEPLLSASSGTIGQRMMNIRVRHFEDPARRIGFLDAYMRSAVKALLGWLSFITINFNGKHRAIHDFAGRSVMVKVKAAALALLILLFASHGYSQAIAEPTNYPSEWTKEYPPFRIVGNVHYVGTYDLACYLITTPEGNILINTGLASSASVIKSNIEALGFKFSDTKILLTTQAHYDHVGAMAEIKRLTGATLMVHEKDAPVLADGGKSDFAFGGEQSTFEPVIADKLLRDGDVITLGNTKLTLLHHPGHTKGSSSFLFDVAPEKWSYRVAIVNMPSIVVPKKFSEVNSYPTIAADYAYTFVAMKNLQFDIWLSSHASQFGLHVKHKPGDPYDAEVFMDRKGYDEAVKGLQEVFDRKLVEK